MTNENCARRSRVVTIVLSTIGGLAILFTVLFFVFIAFVFHSMSTSVKNIVAPISAHKLSTSHANYLVPTGNSPYIAGIKLNAEISDQVADEVIDKLESAQDDNAAVGVLFEVSSPGGAVVPSQEIFDAVKNVRAKKPIVVYVREMAASGAYYSSASASKIIANRGSLIGSIGVVMNGFEANELMQFLKIKPVTIKTGSLKDTGSPMRPMDNNDKKYLQNLIEATRTEFVADVKGERGLSNSTMDFMSDGRVVLAPQAVSLKLIDGIGSKNTALSEITQLAKQKKIPELFYYENIESFSDIFSKNFSSQVTGLLERGAKLQLGSIPIIHL
jgi:protease-4